MAVPKFIEFFTPFLHAVQDGKIHKAKEVQASIAQEMNLSTEDLQEMLPSGRQSTFNNRVAWARTYLDRAGLVETPARAQYRITEQGQKALSCGSIIDYLTWNSLTVSKNFTKSKMTIAKLSLLMMAAMLRSHFHLWKLWTVLLSKSLMHLPMI